MVCVFRKMSERISYFNGQVFPVGGLSELPIVWINGYAIPRNCYALHSEAAITELFFGCKDCNNFFLSCGLIWVYCKPRPRGPAGSWKSMLPQHLNE